MTLFLDFCRNLTMCVGGGWCVNSGMGNWWK